MNQQQPLRFCVFLTLLTSAPFLNAQTQQPTQEQMSRILKRFPEADTDKDGKLSTEEVQAFVKSRQWNRRPRPAAQSKNAGDAKLTETLVSMNARFKNVEVELIEWPAELHKKLGKMTKLALMTRPVEKIDGKLPLLINLHGGGSVGGSTVFNSSLSSRLRSS